MPLLDLCSTVEECTRDLAYRSNVNVSRVESPQSTKEYLRTTLHIPSLVKVGKVSSFKPCWGCQRMSTCPTIRPSECGILFSCFLCCILCRLRKATDFGLHSPASCSCFFLPLLAFLPVSLSSQIPPLPCLTWVERIDGDCSTYLGE